MPYRPAGRLALLLAVGVTLGGTLGGCIDARAERSVTNVIQIRADTVLVGEVSFILGNGFDPQAPGGLDVIRYRNTTSRTFDRLGLALGANVTQSTETCLPLRPYLTDTVYTTVAPGEEFVLLTGILPPSMRVFLTEARSGTTELTTPFAGRWTGTVTTFTDSTVQNRDARAVSQGGGLLAVVAAAPGDTLVFESQLASPRPLYYSAYDGACARTWIADPGSAAFIQGGDSIRITGPALPSSATADQATVPDSFVVRLRRRS